MASERRLQNTCFHHMQPRGRVTLRLIGKDLRTSQLLGRPATFVRESLTTLAAVAVKVKEPDTYDEWQYRMTNFVEAKRDVWLTVK